MQRHLRFDAAEGKAMRRTTFAQLAEARSARSTMGTGTTTATKLIILGDFSTGYKIVDRIGMSAELIPHMLGSNRLPLGVRGLYCYWRTGAGVIAVDAFRYLEVK